MNSISKFWTLGQLSLKKEFIYRIDFLFSIFVVPTILVVNYFVWKAVFSLNEIVAGFTFDQMMAYLVFGQLISIFIFNSTSGEIQRKVQSGDFAQDLLKPIHMFYFLLAGATSARFLAFFLEVVPLTVIAWLLFKFTIPQGIVLGLFIVSLVLAFMLNFIIAFIVGLIAFWTGYQIITTRAIAIIIKRTVVTMPARPLLFIFKYRNYGINYFGGTKVSQPSTNSEMGGISALMPRDST